MLGKRSTHTRSGICEHCGQSYFEVRQSGGKAARYCPDCRVTVRKVQSADRVSRYRERKAKERRDQAFEARRDAIMQRVNRSLLQMGLSPV